MPFGTNLLASQLALSSLAIYQRDRFLGTILAKRDIRQAQKVLRHKRIDTAAAHYVLDEKGATIFEQRFSSPVFPTVLVRTLLKQT